MTSSISRRLLFGIAVLVGVLVTGLGLAIERRQIAETIRTETVEPLLDSESNLLVAICLPALEIVNRFGDFGLPVFLSLLVINVAVWAALLSVLGLAVARWSGRMRSAGDLAA